MEIEKNEFPHSGHNISERTYLLLISDIEDELDFCYNADHYINWLKSFFEIRLDDGYYYTHLLSDDVISMGNPEFNQFGDLSELKKYFRGLWKNHKVLDWYTWGSEEFDIEDDGEYDEEQLDIEYDEEELNE